MCVRYLIKLFKLFPFFLCAATSNRADIQQAVSELNERPPVKHDTLQPDHHHLFLHLQMLHSLYSIFYAQSTKTTEF